MIFLHRFFIFYIAISQVLVAHIDPSRVDADFKFKDRAAWRAACIQLPMNIDVDKHSQNKLQSAFMHHEEIKDNKKLAWAEFDRSLNKVLDLKVRQLSNADAWTDEKKPSKSFYDVSQQVFMPYAQKLELKPHDKVVLHGDFHGDIHSLITELDQLEEQGILKKGSFELADKKAHLAFLGDYVDRGHYGAEVIYTILRLKKANPDNVVMVRGNHEDSAISDHYGFKDELIAKFGSDEGKYEKIYRLYNFLPIVAYIGHKNDYLQCCHGGIESGYNHKQLLQGSGKFDLIGELKRGDFKKYLDDNHEHCKGCSGSWQDCPSAFSDFIPTAPTNKKGNVGFMWGDFVKSGKTVHSKTKRFAANKELTQAVLDYQNEGCDQKVRGIFRAHQHEGSINENDPNNLMYELIASNGVYKLWRPIETGKTRSLVDGLVWTFNLAPDSLVNGYLGSKNKGFGFDAYAILTIKDNYKDWTLQVHNPMIINEPGFAKPSPAQ